LSKKKHAILLGGANDFYRDFDGLFRRERSSPTLKRKRDDLLGEGGWDRSGEETGIGEIMRQQGKGGKFLLGGKCCA